VRPGTLPLLVTAVQEASPAGKAGVRAGDSILEVNGRTPTGFVDFTKSVTAAKDQRDIVLTLNRAGQRRTITLRLVPERSFFNSALVRQKTGASVQDLTPDLARAMGLPAGQGVLISGVDDGTPAATARLEAGMVITHIDGQATPEVVTAAKVLQNKTKGDRAKIALIVSFRRGAFVRLAEATAEVMVR
jgi:serine protease Do